ncbi:hypothetical protein AB0I03_26125, partial [Glycomyces sp. NPDC021274]
RAARGGRTDAATRKNAARGGRVDAAVPSSLSEGRRQSAGAGVRGTGQSSVDQAMTKDDDEEQTQEHKTPSAAGPAPHDAAGTDQDAVGEASPEVQDFVACLPGMDRKGPRDRAALYLLVGAALAAGWTPKTLAAHLAREVSPSRCRNVTAVYGTQLDNLPNPPVAPAPRKAPEGYCSTHPHIWIGDGATCTSCSPRPATGAGVAPRDVLAAAYTQLAQQGRAADISHARS